MTAELPAVLPYLCAAVAVIALLYASVGHAGASGYIAVMSLIGLAASSIKPLALMLNVAVASITTWQFARAGHFRWRLFWPFALTAVPLAAVGGYWTLADASLNRLLGLALCWAAANLLWRPPQDGQTQAPRTWLALISGGALGLLAGLTGTGGGIYLTPLLLFLRWAPMREIAAVSAPFILLNSVAGLAGMAAAGAAIPNAILPLLIAVALGGGIGAQLGAAKLPVEVIKRLLALVLAIAGAKLLLA
jgi:hypothetical protein